MAASGGSSNLDAKQVFQVLNDQAATDFWLKVSGVMSGVMEASESAAALLPTATAANKVDNNKVNHNAFIAMLNLHFLPQHLQPETFKLIIKDLMLGGRKLDSSDTVTLQQFNAFLQHWGPFNNCIPRVINSFHDNNQPNLVFPDWFHGFLTDAQTLEILLDAEKKNNVFPFLVRLNPKYEIGPAFLEIVYLVNRVYINLKSSFPENLNDFKNQYIFIKSNGNDSSKDKLYYVNENGEAAEVTITDRAKFRVDIDNFKLDNPDRVENVANSTDQKLRVLLQTPPKVVGLQQKPELNIKSMITANGGHIPIGQKMLKTTLIKVDMKGLHCKIRGNDKTLTKYQILSRIFDALPEIQGYKRVSSAERLSADNAVKKNDAKDNKGHLPNVPQGSPAMGAVGAVAAASHPAAALAPDNAPPKPPAPVAYPPNAAAPAVSSNPAAKFTAKNTTGAPGGATTSADPINLDNQQTTTTPGKTKPGPGGAIGK